MIISNGRIMPWVLPMRWIGSNLSSDFLLLFCYSRCQFRLIFIQKTGHRLVIDWSIPEISLDQSFSVQSHSWSTGQTKDCSPIQKKTDWKGFLKLVPVPVLAKNGKMTGLDRTLKPHVQWGYHNVRIKEGDKWKAAFWTN